MEHLLGHTLPTHLCPWKAQICGTGRDTECIVEVESHCTSGPQSSNALIALVSTGISHEQTLAKELASRDSDQLWAIFIGACGFEHGVILNVSLVSQLGNGEGRRRDSGVSGAILEHWVWEESH